MRRPAILFLTALGLAGTVGAGAAARSHGGGGAAPPRRELLSGSVVVQRSASNPSVVLVVDGGTRGQAADGIADRVYVLQRVGAPAANQVLRYNGARVLFDEGTILVKPADGTPAVGFFLAGREALSPAATAFLDGTPVGERWTGRGLALRRGEVHVGAAGLSASTMRSVLASCGGTASGSAARTGGARTGKSPPGCPGGGSTDCTNSTCQIFCVQGFHACCNCNDPTNCKCSCVRD
ncbi:MAG TPA: hypothetical protein VF771_01145 [Longimicrobiaceae bacterium]